MVLPILKAISQNSYLFNDKSLSATLEGYSNRSLAFAWVHAGRLTMTIEEISSLLINNEILPARTGHLGNWQEIAAGRSGALDHNEAVCGKRNLGYPLITEFNQTENQTMTGGDTVYLPGSIVSKEKRECLKLFTWDGKKFAERSREESYFVPFVLTPIGGELIPLVSIHRSHCSEYKNAKFISSLIIENNLLVREIISALIELARLDSQSGIELSDIVDRVVSIGGKVFRENLSYSEGKYKIGNLTYSNTDDLMNAIFFPINAAHEPNSFFNNISEMPSAMPLLSLSLSCALDYILSNQLSKEKGNVNLYFEWGAFDSAGYPPRSNGYYKQKAKIIRNIYQAVIKIFSRINPVFFVMLPSPIFNLLPNSAYPTDIKHLSELFTQVIEQGESLNSLDSDAAMNKVQNIVNQWFQSNSKDLSPYYIGRFTKRRCVHHQTQYHEYGEIVDISQFNELTLQQACMIVGAMFSAAKENS